MERKEALEIAARIWCDWRTEKKVMDASLCGVFAEKLAEKVSQAEAKAEVLVKALESIIDYEYGAESSPFVKWSKSALSEYKGEK